MKDIPVILDLARAYVSQGFTKGQLARDWRGDMCEPDSDRAVAWCSEGACHAAVFDYYGERNTEVIDDCLEVLRHALDMPRSRSVCGWNDSETTTQGIAVSVFDKAIRMTSPGR